MKRPNNWFFFAQEDLRTAKALLKAGIYNQVCFHCQQGVEKTLKGFLRSRGKSVPKTHSLDDLVEMCSEIDAKFRKIETPCAKLDDYYIPARRSRARP
jgi:HEPN domain-containing protein